MHFNASVEPIPLYLGRIRQTNDKKDYKRIKSKFDYLTSHLIKHWLTSVKKLKSLLTNKESELKANIIVDKFGLFQDLREYVSEIQERLDYFQSYLVYPLLVKIVVFFIREAPLLIALPVAAGYTEGKTVILNYVDITPFHRNKVCFKTGKNIIM